jgi:hypothetical protein
MDDVVHSHLQVTVSLASRIHIRYSQVKASRRSAQPRRGKEPVVPHHTVITSTDRKCSYVIIRREYSHLEPLIRATFADAEDVQVFIDRRLSNRRKLQAEHLGEDSRRSNDRRDSVPTLDIVISTSGMQPL